ncbi:hypothetical protein [Rummeliibacillus suwonensis]|uniref:hypothetical protein n=1 Tax=Rummeliibacillus suwonensis TaxID=1306154 RepID=UPI0028999353|nr:hypothetical protein [Rummeliibacillus suwonensis]
MGFVKNIVTFGAAGRVEAKIEEYESYIDHYNRKYEEMETAREAVNHQLEDLVKLKVQSINALKKITKISKNLRGKKREVLVRKVGNEFQAVNIEQVENTLTMGQAAINATKGAVSGVSTALGAWALVSTLGTASTGTAIGTISGVAATNATLAWFGGGAIAAGGAGMAGGAAVLGGLVAVPALVLTGVFSHIKANKQISEIEEKLLELYETVDQIESNLFQIKLTSRRSQEIQDALIKANEVFTSEFDKVYKELYKRPYISKSWKWIKRNILRKDSFTKEEYLKIAYIGGIAQEFATIIDSKVFDDNGNVYDGNDY